MEPAQEVKCKEREKKLIISLGADNNCNHPYEYEKNKSILFIVMMNSYQSKLHVDQARSNKDKDTSPDSQRYQN